MTDGPPRTVFLGSGGFGEPTLRWLIDDPAVDLVGVVTVPPRAVGRSQTLTSTPIGRLAAERGVKHLLMPPRLREPHAISDVLELGPELLVLADYGQIVPSALLDVRLGALNLHPSLLPRHRGATPIPAAILAGDPETGVTLMRMDDGLDTGPIVDRTVVPLEGRETAPDLEAVLASVAADLLRRALPSWLAGQQATPQADDGATMTRPLRREDGRLQPHMDAARLERQVRAYQPWPGSFVETPDGRLTIWSAELGGPTDAAPGAVGKTGVAAGDARWLRLVEVQPAGGRRMPWAAYLRGRPSIVGASIVE